MFENEIAITNSEAIKKLESPDIFFSENGCLKKEKKDFRLRTQQREMAEAVLKNFMQRKNLFVEAGTGTGKSFAYLYPAILQALIEEERVVVSTQTIALQEQVFLKDLPFLERILGLSLKKSIAKGRGNYLCQRKYEVKNSDDYISLNEKNFLNKLDPWIKKTIDGDKEEAGLLHEEWIWWSNIASNSEDCFGATCTKYRDCYYFRQRRMIERSSVIVTNHSLLIRDLKMDNKILPEYSYLVIDEGHNFPDEFINQYTETFDFKKEIYSSDFLSKNRQGLIRKLERNFKDNLFFKDIALYLEKCRQYLDQLVNHLEQIIILLETQTSLFSSEKRIKEEMVSNGFYQDFFEKAQNAAQIYKQVADILTKIFEVLENEEIYQDLSLEVKIIQSQIYDKIALLQSLGEPNFSKNIYWIKNSKIFIAPLEVSQLISKNLFKEERSIVVTSATLTVNNKFKYIFDSYGLREEQADYLRFDSPFDFKNQTHFYYVNQEMTDQMLISNINNMIDNFHGGTLVLFTNHDLLKKAYYYLQEKNPQKVILADGISGSRRHVIASFRKSKDAVLLGADSFWEGIDLEGNLLRNLVMTKLPFLPPNRPVVEANLEKIQRSGGNNFYEYSIPKAVIKFRQGFGRLIRAQDDQGSFYLLDHRIINKGYGKIFINSIPEMDKSLIKMVN